MAALQYLYDPTNPVVAPFGSSQVLNVGDLVGIDGSGNLYRAEDVLFDVNEGSSRVTFASEFLGVVAQRKRTADTQPYGNSAAVARVDTSGIFEADLDTATTLVVGDLVGPDKAAGSALVSQRVKKVTSTPTQAIGVVVEAGTSLTRCKFRILSTKTPFSGPLS